MFGFLKSRVPVLKRGTYWIEWENCSLPDDHYFVSESTDKWITVQRIGNPLKVVVSVSRMVYAANGDPKGTKLWE